MKPHQVLTVLLGLGLGTGVAHAQKEDKAQAGQAGDEAAKETGVTAPNAEATVTIRVDQDPTRIGPGETGTMLLIVAPLPGAAPIPAGFRVEVPKSQGPLTFGAPLADPPAGGKSAYSDSFLIRVPVTARAGTPYQRYDVRGWFRYRGAARTEVVGPGPGAADGGIPKAPENSGPRGVRLVPTEVAAEIKGLIRVGPPIPKPKRRARRSKTPARTATGTQPGKAGSKPGTRPGTGPDRPGPAALGGNAASGSGPGVDSSGPDGGGGSGFPLYLIGGAGLALVLLVLLKRSA